MNTADKHTKVLGYVSRCPGSINMLCDGDSCIVAGSEAAMKRYISDMAGDKSGDYNISKARYGQILQALKLGAGYSFDSESFSRFCPLAVEDGMEMIDFTPDDQDNSDGSGIPLMRIQWLTGSQNSNN